MQRKFRREESTWQAKNVGQDFNQGFAVFFAGRFQRDSKANYEKAREFRLSHVSAC